MEMTEWEIVKSYKEAAYPQEQIKILADINICPPRQIIDILRNNGLDVPDMKTGRPRRKKDSDTDTKPSTKEKPSHKEDKQTMVAFVIPDAVQKLAFTRLGELDEQMQSLKKSELEIKRKLESLEKEYAEIVGFLGV